MTQMPELPDVDRPSAEGVRGILKYVLTIGGLLAFIIGLPASLCGLLFTTGLLTRGPEILDHAQGREGIFFYGIPALIAAVIALGVSLLLFVPLRKQSKLASLYLKVIGVVTLVLMGLLIVVEVLVNRYQIPTVSPVTELIGHEDGVTSVAFSPDGNILASSGIGHTVRLWDMAAPSNDPVILTGHDDVVRVVAFHPDGELLASGGNDHTILLWNLMDPDHALAALTGHEHFVTALAINPDGTTLASCSSDHSIRLWDLSDLSQDSLEVWDDYVYDIAFSPDGKMLAFSSDEIYLRNLDELFGSVAEFPTGGRQVLSIDFNPDGSLLGASAGPSEGKGGVIHLWDITDPHAPPIILEGHTNTIGTITISHDGQLLASEGLAGDPTVQIWTLADPTAEPIILRGAYPSDLAFSPDGKNLAIAGGDGKIRVWEISALLGAKTR